MGRVSPATTPVIMPTLQPRRKLCITAIIGFAWWMLCQLGCAGAAIVYWLHGRTFVSCNFAVTSLLSCASAAICWRRRYVGKPQQNIPLLP